MEGVAISTKTLATPIWLHNRQERVLFEEAQALWESQRIQYKSREFLRDLMSTDTTFTVSHVVVSTSYLSG